MSYGLYLEIRDAEGLADQLGAWSLVLSPAAAFTHLTAAELRGWWLPQKIPHPVFAALCEGDPCPHRAGLYVSRHPHRVPSELVSGVRLTTPAETLLAAARDLGVLDLVLMGDSALRLGHCTIDDLVETAAQRRRGAPMLRQVIGLLDKRSESAWESVMRVLHRAADIPVEPQHEIFDQWGRFVARGDLWIVGTNRLHEFDGGKHREPEVGSDPRSTVDRGRLPAIRLHQSSAAQRRSLHHRFDRQAAGSQLGSFPAPPVERPHRRFDVRPSRSRPSSPQLATA
jgi:hypothetical protein